MNHLPAGEAWFVLAALCWLLIGPRIAVPGALGIRYEDLLFFALAVVAVRTRDRLRLLVSPASLGIAAVTVASAVSTCVATAAGRVEPTLAALYTVRPLEYWFVYPSVMLLIANRAPDWSRRLRLLLAAVTLTQTGFAVAQFFFHVEIGFSHQSYGRGAGLTAGPYELGAISASLLIFWISQRRWVLGAIALLGLLTSISRISIVGAAVGLLVLGVLMAARGIRDRDPRPRSRRTAVIAGLVGAAVVVAFTALSISGALAPLSRATAPLTERFTSTSVLGSWTAAEDLASVIPPIRTASEYNSVAFTHIFDNVNASDASEVGAEPSNLVRFFRWHLILDNMRTPDVIVFGLGPSFVGGSVDGSYLRFYADGGILGVLAWLALIVGWCRRTPPWMLAVVASMLVGAVFIDIVYALRAMVLLWALLALARSAGIDADRSLLQRRPLARHSASRT